MKLSSKTKGKIGEFIAVSYLRMKSYKLVRKNLQLKSGEIDILMKKNKTLIAIEVKLRQKKDDITYAITKKQYQRIANSLIQISEEYPEFTDIRIDGIFISLKPFSIEHLTLEEELLF